jgi:hypothetical protein
VPYQTRASGADLKLGGESNKRFSDVAGRSHEVTNCLWIFFSLFHVIFSAERLFLFQFLKQKYIQHTPLKTWPIICLISLFADIKKFIFANNRAFLALVSLSFFTQITVIIIKIISDQLPVIDNL